MTASYGKKLSTPQCLVAPLFEGKSFLDIIPGLWVPNFGVEGDGLQRRIGVKSGLELPRKAVDGWLPIHGQKIKIFEGGKW